jgi:hypothetical protein
MPVAELIDGFDLSEPAQIGLADARRQDAYWARTYWRERYFRPEFDYEDYAPAYCVGYIGHLQYGGDFEDAVRSLFANWECIKGNSRLSLDEAHQAIRAAWDRMAHEGVLAMRRLSEGWASQQGRMSSSPQVAIQQG